MSPELESGPEQTEAVTGTIPVFELGSSSNAPAGRKAQKPTIPELQRSESPDPLVGEVNYPRLPNMESSIASGSSFDPDDHSPSGSSAFVAGTMDQHGHEPDSYARAVASAAAEQWQKAMDEEINSLKENHTWDLVDLPAGRAALRGKWVYKLKHGPDGRVVKHKARWVVNVGRPAVIGGQQ